ncbi:MAG: tRNA sulfurtransferase, partial [Halobacteriaceae archaeon]
MKPPGASDIVVRYGDMSTKSNRVQTKLEKQLVSNIEALLQDRNIDATVERKWTRPIVHTDESQVEAATQAITQVFGVVSVSPALTVNATREEIKQALAKTAKKEYTSGSFAVRARRASDTYPFTSQDIGEFGGSAVWNAVADSFEPAVDLDDPDIEFFVEVRDDNAYVFLEKRAGPGGLPLGSQDPVVALISGGIDSPVAAYEMMKRGCPIIPVYIDLGDYGGPDHEARAMAAISTLKEYAPNFEISP